MPSSPSVHHRRAPPPPQRRAPSAPTPRSCLRRATPRFSSTAMDRSTRGVAGLLLTCRLSARGRHPTAQPSSRRAITSRPATSTLVVRPRLAAAYPHHRAASPHSKIDRAPLLVPNPNPRVLAPVRCHRLSRPHHQFLPAATSIFVSTVAMVCTELSTLLCFSIPMPPILTIVLFCYCINDKTGIKRRQPGLQRIMATTLKNHVSP